jgi:hypothetical protein
VIEGMFLCYVLCCGTRRRRKVRICWKADMLSQKIGCLSVPQEAVFGASRGSPTGYISKAPITPRVTK